jgi:hypothetical protein
MPLIPDMAGRLKDGEQILPPEGPGASALKPVQNLDGAYLFYIPSSVVRRMAKSSFKVGEKEKHTLTVDHDWLTKHICIELDGEKLADEHYYSLLAKTWSFDVGTSEVHKVKVKLGMTLPLVAIFKRRGLKVLVDGKPARSSGT